MLGKPNASPLEGKPTESTAITTLTNATTVPKIKHSGKIICVPKMTFKFQVRYSI